MERHSFHMVSCELPKTMRKLCLFTKFPHQEIRWNHGIFHSEQFFETPLDRWSMSHVQRTFLNNNDLYLKWNFLYMYSVQLHCVESVQIRSFFWSVFLRIQSEYGKIRTRKNSVFGVSFDAFRKTLNIWSIEYLRKTHCVITSYFGALSIIFSPNCVKWFSLKILWYIIKVYIFLLM